MKPNSFLAFYVIVAVVVTTVSGQLRQKRVEHSGMSSDILRSPFQPPDEHGNTLNYEEKHLEPPVQSLGPQKSPFLPPGGNNDNKNAPNRPVGRVKSVQKSPEFPKFPTQNVFDPPQNVNEISPRNVKATPARDDNHVSPFLRPSGPNQSRKTSLPEITPKKPGHVLKSRVKGAKRQPPPSRLDDIIARQRDNSHDIPPISDIRLKARNIAEPLPKPVSRRRGGDRGRPRHTAFQNNSRRPKQRDMHDVGPGVTPWTRYTARPRNAPRRQDSKSSFKGRCGNVSYSPREHICCQGNVSRRQGTQPSCCGRSTYDAVYKKCCHGKVVMRTAAC